MARDPQRPELGPPPVAHHAAPSPDPFDATARGVDRFGGRG